MKHFHPLLYYTQGFTPLMYATLTGGYDIAAAILKTVQTFPLIYVRYLEEFRSTPTHLAYPCIYCSSLVPRRSGEPGNEANIVLTTER